MLRSIHIFPRFQNIDEIQRIRERFDPLAGLIAPHITLVFPFQSEVSQAELAAHMLAALDGERPFQVELQGVTGGHGGYLFLNVKTGNDDLVRLHDRLYERVLRPHLIRSLTYTPHLTVGHLPDEAAFQDALEVTDTFTNRFRTQVNEVVMEVIDADGQSSVEFVATLF